MLGFEAEDGTKFGQNGSGTIEVLLPRHLYESVRCELSHLSVSKISTHRLRLLRITPIHPLANLWWKWFNTRCLFNQFHTKRTIQMQLWYICNQETIKNAYIRWRQCQYRHWQQILPRLWRCSTMTKQKNLLFILADSRTWRFRLRSINYICHHNKATAATVTLLRDLNDPNTSVSLV